MANSNSSTTPESVKFNTGDIVGNREHNWCYGFVVRRGTAAGGRVSGYYVETIVNDETGLTGRIEFIPDEFAVLICGAVTITVREDVRIAACSLPTDPNSLAIEPVEVREARAAEWDRVRLSGIEAAERMKAKGDSQRVTARILGDVLANEQETINGKIEAK